MKVGTKSVLFGAHCFFIHPVFVLVAWIKLFGFPWDPRLWVAFFVHDLGYWGKPNTDGPEGETHVELGGKIMAIFDHDCKDPRCYKRTSTYNIISYDGQLIEQCKECHKWYQFSIYHSRFYAKKDNNPFSKLCVADKLAICLEPYWLYLPRVNWSGEIHEYMKLAGQRKYDGEPVSKYETMKLSTKSQKDWFRAVTSYLFRWVEEHMDMKEDTWTPETKKA